MTTSRKTRDTVGTVLSQVRAEQPYMQRPVMHEYMTMVEQGFILPDDEWERLLEALADEAKRYEAWLIDVFKDHYWHVPRALDIECELSNCSEAKPKDSYFVHIESGKTFCSINCCRFHWGNRALPISQDNH